MPDDVILDCILRLVAPLLGASDSPQRRIIIPPSWHCFEDELATHRGIYLMSLPRQAKYSLHRFDSFPLRFIFTGFRFLFGIELEPLFLLYF